MITRQTHNFPNLAIMKLSAWHKKQGDDVRLINFDMINPMNMFTEYFDTVYISKVFSDTQTPAFIDNLSFVKKGGSGFYYDLAEKLPNEIEHIKPDYEIYNKTGEYYKNFSIGFITRGCIRQCSFCINKNYKKVDFASNPIEFIDEKRPFIMLLDDNITAYKDFEGVFNELNAIGKPFVFKQGMDFRLLNEKKMQILWNSNYYSTSKKTGKQDKGGRVFHFAFDNIEDSELIEKRLRQYFFSKPYAFVIMFYVLTGFDRNGIYDEAFFEKDFEDILKRIALLFKYNAQPYIMIHEDIKLSPYKDRIYELRNIFNNIMNYAQGTKYALDRFGKKELKKLIEDKYSWFLDVKYETRLYRNIPESERSLYCA
jgi:hypothetical protein